MLQKVVLYHRYHEADDPQRFFPQRRLKNTYVALDVLLSKLAVKIGWFTGQQKVIQERILLRLYVQGLAYYLLLANLKNWNQVVLVSARELNKLSHKKRAKDLSQIYLALKKMLYNSYFFHRQNDFMYSWKLYLKWGLVDCHLPIRKILQQFDQAYRLKKH